MEYRLACPALLVSDPINQRYFTQLAFSHGVTYVSERQSAFLYWRMPEKPKLPDGLKAMEIRQEELGDAVRKLLEEDEVSYLTVEKTIPLAVYSAVSAGVRDIRVAAEDAVAALREVKSEWELAQIRRACEITDRAFEEVLSFIKPGKSELEVAAFLEYQMRIQGSEEPNRTIVAAGKNSAYPHHWPTSAPIRTGDFVTMDFGCTYNGYHSDLTRTIVVGQPSERQRRIYDLVAQAQLAGISVLQEGIRGKEADAAARSIIDGSEFQGSFLHGLGHGIGLDIHEGTGLGKTEEGILKAGMVVSIEPGIYLEGYGGVRIEDIAVIKKEGAELLELSPKQLIVL